MKFLKLAKRSESLSWHLNFLLLIVDPKLYDTHELYFTQCSRQELSESTCISLITLPLRRRPLISLAKLTAWKTDVVIRGSPYVKAIVRDTRSSLSRCILRNLSVRFLSISQCLILVAIFSVFNFTVLIINLELVEISMDRNYNQSSKQDSLL